MPWAPVLQVFFFAETTPLGGRRHNPLCTAVPAVDQPKTNADAEPFFGRHRRRRRVPPVQVERLGFEHKASDLNNARQDIEQVKQADLPGCYFKLRVALMPKGF